jgi:hypothetical protein
MGDRFTGRWLVSEYVYDDRGVFLGIVHQRRALEAQADGTVRVVQQCTPEASLDHHPMSEFRGEWVFTLRRDGRRRIYEGPDVVGLGLSWGDGAITGRGVWTRFGHNFTSFGVMATPERQLTGGRFYNGTELIATIIGVAVPERTSAIEAFPTLSGPKAPCDVSRLWQGSAHLYTAHGELKYEVNQFERVCSETGWTTTLQGKTQEEMLFVPRQRRIECLADTIRGRWTGIGRCVGWMLEIDGVFQESPDMQTDYFAVLDGEGGNYVGIRRVMRNDVFSELAIERLRPL